MNNIRFVNTTEWKVNRDTAVGLNKVISAETEDAGDRRLRFTISTEDVDRYNDRVIQSGWQLKNYESNGVVLFQHDPSLVIGRCVELTPVGTRLKATVEFVDSSMPHFGELADGVYTMLKGKYLNAISVGFRVLDYRDADDKARPYGVDYTSMDLLEFSVVTIPALPEALIEPGQRQYDPANFAWHDAKKRQRAIELISKLNSNCTHSGN